MGKGSGEAAPSLKVLRLKQIKHSLELLVEKNMGPKLYSMTDTGFFRQPKLGPDGEKDDLCDSIKNDRLSARVSTAATSQENKLTYYRGRLPPLFFFLKGFLENSFLLCLSFFLLKEKRCERHPGQRARLLLKLW